MAFKQLSCILTSVISLVMRIPDRLLEMAWKVVMAIAPIHTNVAIDVKSLFTWNVIPYRSAKVPVSRWAEFLVAAHEYQEAIKDKLWADVKENVKAVRLFSIKYIQDEVGLKSLYPYGCILLKALKSLFLLVKAQECYKVSLRALRDLKEEMKREEVVEEVNHK